MIFVCYSLPGRTIVRTLIFHNCSSHTTDQITSQFKYEFLQQGILTVVDVFSEWAGPCNAMQNYLKKIKLEVLNVTIMKMAMAMRKL